MEQDQARKMWLVGACVLSLLAAAGLYADKVYEAPQPPPRMIYTIKGPVVLHETAQAGDLVTAPNLGTIYYINGEGKRVVFPDEQTFRSWYPDFSLVKTVPQDVLESFPLSGRNATIRPGTYLVKIQSAPFVYLIGFQKTLFSLANEQQALAVLGEGWQGRVVDVPEYFFVNYDEGIMLSGIDLLPGGFVYRAQSNGITYIVTPEGQRVMDERGLKANHVDERFIVQRADPLDLPLSGPTVSGYEPRWGSPDTLEQINDRGPADVNTAGRETEAG